MRNGVVRVAVVVVLASASAVGCGDAVTVAPAPPEVYVANVVARDVPEYLELVGQTSGFQDVEIRARVEGYLETVNFKEGSFVKRGDLLYEIDRKPLEAILAGARADKATADARLEKANNDVARYTPLVAKQAVSQQELDNALAAQDATRSQVDAARAAVDKATLDLGYTRIASPIAGLVGTTQVKPGNLVGRGVSTLLTTVSQIDPINLRVGVGESEYLRIARREASRDGEAGRSNANGIELTLADGSVYPFRGRLGSIERALDPTTGTLAVEYTFPNPELLLRPGQYGKARLLLDTKKAALLVPQRAVQELQSLFSVAVVDEQNRVLFRNVKMGARVDGLWVVEDGLKLNERVVVEGLQRVRDGMTVVAKAAPANLEVRKTAS